MSPPARSGGGGRSVAFTAPPAFPDLHDDWPLQRSALASIGVDAAPVVWSDPDVDWSQFDLVVANGAWDNIHHRDEFLHWVAHVEGLGVTMVNSPSTLLWNFDKRYLQALEGAGIRVVPTRWVEATSGPDGPAVPAPAFDGEVVVKPSVSGGGFQTARYEPHQHDAARAHVDALVNAGTAAMVQPYQESVDKEGETGLVFLGGEYSHAIHKEPMIRRGVAPGESLIDNQVVTGASAALDQLRLGRAAVAAAEALLGPTTYARVDMVRGADGEPALLELELLDPVLFMTTAPASADRFARVLADRVAVR